MAISRTTNYKSSKERPKALVVEMNLGQIYYEVQEYFHEKMLNFYPK